jgi:hypothetical protein
VKTLLKIAGAVVGCLILLLVVLRFTGLDPHGHMPGLWLSGTLVTTPVADWSFTDKFPLLEIETRTWYLLPHSVITTSICYQGQLYVGSPYRAGLKFPGGRTWNEDVVRDPHVRLKIGNRLYDRMLVHVTDPAVIAGVLQARDKKYGNARGIPPGETLEVFHVVGN